MVGKNKTGQIVLNIIFILLCTAAVAPFLLLLSSSLTDEATLMRGRVQFYPEGFQYECLCLSVQQQYEDYKGLWNYHFGNRCWEQH